MIDHLEKAHPNSFTAKYNINKLVYFKLFDSIEEAIREEKRIKGGSKKAKVALVYSINPLWEDLWLKEVSKW